MRSNKVINKGKMHCSYNISLTLLFEIYLEDSTLVKIYFSVLKNLIRTMIPLNLSSEERWNSTDQSKGWVFWTLNKIIIELDGPLSVKTD